MVKAKDIISIKDNIIKYKNELDKERDPIKILKIERKIRVQQYRLMDVESQLFNIEISLHKDSQLHKEIFMDKYINGLTVKQLVNKYRISRSSIYIILNRAKALFENNELKI